MRGRGVRRRASRDKTYRCDDYTVGCIVTARRLPLLATALLMLGSLAVIGYRTTTSLA
jgi:hypothetical protein